ncbi:hypothetical protein MPLSOD_90064 [Mesorhizobium sp. SOD10]|nr:hypothetical protein MPLSOD_90064 [Mesorhizobium sp. SOD10]
MFVSTEITRPEYACYTIKDFCRAYGVSRSLVYKEMAAGRLTARKAGRRTLILKEVADDWLRTLPMARSGRPLQVGVSSKRGLQT